MAKKIPMRQCVGCGEMKSKKEMMRILKTPEKRMEEALVCVRRRNALQKHEKIKD